MKRRYKALLFFAGLLLLGLLGVRYYLDFKANKLLSHLVRELSNNTYKVTSSKAIISYYPAGIAVKDLEFGPVTDTGHYVKGRVAQASVSLRSLLGLVAYKRIDVQELTLRNPEIISVGTASRSGDKGNLASTMHTIQQGLLTTIQQLKVRNTAIRDASLRVDPHPGAKDFLFVNHINVDMKDILIQADKDMDSLPEFSGRIKVRIDDPDLHLPDTSFRAKLGSMEFSTADNYLQIDRVAIHYQLAKQEKDSFNLTSIRVTGFNWNKYLKSGIFMFDSVLAADGNAFADFRDDALSNNTRKKSSDGKATYQGLSLMIHYANVSNIKYELRTSKSILNKQAASTFTLKGNELTAGDISLLSGRSPALDIGSLKVDITEYKDVSPGSNFMSSLSQLSIERDNLLIRDYTIFPAAGRSRSNQNLIYLPEIKLIGYSLPKLLRKQISAKSLILSKPQVQLDVLRKNKAANNTNPKTDALIAALTEKLDPRIELSDIDIEDAEIRLQMMGSPTDAIALKDLSLKLDAKKMLGAKRLPALLNSITTFTTKGFTVGGQKTNLKVDDIALIEQGNGLYFGRVSGNLSPEVHIDLKDVSLLDRNETFSISNMALMELSHIIAGSGIITIKGKTKQPNPEQVSKTLSKLLSGEVDLKNMVIRYEGPEGTAVSAAFNIKATGFALTGKKATWQKLEVTSTEAKFGNNRWQLFAGSIQLEQPGFLRVLKANGTLQTPAAKLTMDIPEMLLKLSIQGTEVKHLKITAATLMEPRLNWDIFKKTGTEQTPVKNRPQLATSTLELDELVLHKPIISVSHQQPDKQISALLQDATLKMLGFSMKPVNGAYVVEASKFYLNTQAADVNYSKESFSKAGLEAECSNLLWDGTQKKWSAIMNKATASNLSRTWILGKKDTLSVKVDAITIGKRQIGTDYPIELNELIKGQEVAIANATLQLASQYQLLQLYGLYADKGLTTTLRFDSMHLLNREDKPTFWKRNGYEKDYITIISGAGSARDVSFNWEDGLKRIHIPYMTLDSWQLNPERDKRQPDDTVTYRPLLARMLGRIPIDLQLDSLHLTKGFVRYADINERNKESSIFFSNIHGWVTGVKNHNLQPKDSIRLDLRCKLMDTGSLRLRFHQSYTDTLQGFWLSTRMSKMKMAALNSMAEAFGVRISGGTIDSLRLRVKGNDIFAYGKMDLRYKGLRLNILDKEGKARHGVSRIVDWAANSLVRGNDNGRNDLLFKNRLQNKSTFNFWGKIFAEGMLTNFGIRSDRKEKKRFFKTLKKLDLPSEEWEGW